MEAKFSIVADPVSRIIRITMSGFYGEADIRRFVATRNAEHARLGGSPNAHLTLVDIRGMKIQSRESVDAFAGILGDPRFRSQRIAFVVEASLARMQLERAAAGRNGRFFRTMDEAEAWLAAERQIA